MGLVEESYTNFDIQRGKELESIARSTYEFEYGVEVRQCGFIEHSKYCGVSPDGIIGDFVKGLELKARNNKIHGGLLYFNDEVDSSAIWQMNMCMLVAETDSWDFGSYNPNFEKALFVKTFYRDETKIKALETGIKIASEKIEEILTKITLK